MPTAEIIAIGTEILLGQITDTNSQFLSEGLARLGIDCFFHTTVGDNRERIKDCLKTALSRSDIVLTTGGLGPTPDDLTIETIAECLEQPLELDPQVLAKIEGLFKSRNIPMPESNARQAMRPRGSAVLDNPVGTAPGIIWELSRELLAGIGIQTVESDVRKLILTFPGVPHEMKRMWSTTAAPYLMQERMGGAIFSIDLKHIGIGESSLAEKYEHLLDGGNPSVAPYAGRGECRLRVTAKAGSLDEARALAMPLADDILKTSGNLCYGVDTDTLESVVARLLIDNNLTVSLAESCTGGLVSKRLTDVPGSSAFIGLNLVTYSNAAKERELQIDARLLSEFGAVSAECARAMAKGIRRKSGTDTGIGVTGIAGPDGGSPAKPVGLVYLALDSEKGEELVELNLGEKSTRSDIRHATANATLNMLRLFLIKHYKN